jgi:hypothetical protein
MNADSRQRWSAADSSQQLCGRVEVDARDGGETGKLVSWLMTSAVRGRFESAIGPAKVTDVSIGASKTIRRRCGGCHVDVKNAWERRRFD